MIVASRLYQAAVPYLALKASCRIHIYNAQAHPLLQDICHQAHCYYEQVMKPAYDALQIMGVVSESGDDVCDIALVFPTKQKQQTKAMLAKAMLALREGGVLLLCAENRYGAKSYEAALKQLFGNVLSSSKSKTRCCKAVKSSAADVALMQTWLDDGMPRVMTHGLMAAPGMFHWGAMDAGSRLLLDVISDALVGVGMDLCCGFGVLAHDVLQTQGGIQHVHLVDADADALRCAAHNVATLALSHAGWETHWLDAAHDDLPKNLDWVLCNPPFHAGQERDVSLGQSIVAKGCQSLKRGGCMYMVANRQLPYESVLQAHCSRVEILTQQQGYKIIKGVR